MKAPFFIATFIVGLALLSFHHEAQAETGDIALGAKASTLGVGPDLTIGLLDSLNINLAGHWGTIEVDGEGEDIDYDCDLDLESGLLSLNWYPFGGDRDFHIVVGALLNGNNFEASADLKFTGTYTIGGHTYSYSDIGRLEGEIDYDDVGPYIGIGFGNPVRKDSNFSFFVDIAVAYQGPADVSFTATGTAASNSVFLADLKEEEDELEDDLNDFKYYPVISLGLTYKF